MKEQQLEFDFAKANNELEGKTCRTCKHAIEDFNLCTLDKSEINDSFTCGFYEQTQSSMMRDITVDVAKRFDVIMDFYAVADEDRKEIISICKWL